MQRLIMAMMTGLALAACGGGESDISSPTKGSVTTEGVVAPSPNENYPTAATSPSVESMQQGNNPVDSTTAPAPPVSQQDTGRGAGGVDGTEDVTGTAHSETSGYSTNAGK